MIIESLKKLAVPIDSLVSDPQNSRVHPPRNLEALRNSLQYYGQRKPIIVRRENNRIIAGNGLWQAAKTLGWKEIAVVFVDDNETMATGYAIMDNQSALLADWDYKILDSLLAELREADFDLNLTGFGPEELKAFGSGEFQPRSRQEPIDEEELAKTKHKCPKCGFEW